MKTLTSISLLLLVCSVCLAFEPGTEDAHAKTYVKVADNKAAFVISISNEQQPGIYSVLKTYSNGKIEQVDIHKTKPHKEGKNTWHSFIDSNPGNNPVNGVPYGYTLVRMDQNRIAQVVTSWKYDPKNGEIHPL